MSSKVIKWFIRQASFRRPSDKEKTPSPKKQSEEKKKFGLRRLSFRKKSKAKSLDSALTSNGSPESMGAPDCPFDAGATAASVTSLNGHPTASRDNESVRKETSEDFSSVVQSPNQTSVTVSSGSSTEPIDDSANDTKDSDRLSFYSAYDNESKGVTPERSLINNTSENIPKISENRLDEHSAECANLHFPSNSDSKSLNLDTKTLKKNYETGNGDKDGKFNNKDDTTDILIKEKAKNDRQLEVEHTFDEILKLNSIEINNLDILTVSELQPSSKNVSSMLSTEENKIMKNELNIVNSACSQFIENEVTLVLEKLLHDVITKSSEKQTEDNGDIVSHATYDKNESSESFDKETCEKCLDKVSPVVSKPASLTEDIEYIDSEESYSSHHSELETIEKESETKENRKNKSGEIDEINDTKVLRKSPTIRSISSEDRSNDATFGSIDSCQSIESEPANSITVIVTEPSPDFAKHCMVFSPPIQTSPPTTPAHKGTCISPGDYPEELNPFGEDDDADGTNPFGSDSEDELQRIQSSHLSNEKVNSTSDTEFCAKISGIPQVSTNPFGEYEDVEIDRFSPTNPFADDDGEEIENEHSAPRLCTDTPPRLPPKGDGTKRKTSLSSTPVPHPRKTKQKLHGSFTSLQSVPVPAPRTLTPTNSSKNLNDTSSSLEETYFSRGSYGRASVQVLPSYQNEGRPFIRSGLRGSVPPEGSKIRIPRKKRQAPMPPGKSMTTSPITVPYSYNVTFNSLPRKQSTKNQRKISTTSSYSSQHKPPPRPPPPKALASPSNS